MKNTRTVDFVWQFDASFALALPSVCQFLQANAVCKGVWEDGTIYAVVIQLGKKGGLLRRSRRDGSREESLLLG